MFDPLINLRFSVRAATDGTNFYRKISKWRRSVFLFSLMGNSGSHHSLSLCKNRFKKWKIFTKVGFFNPVKRRRRRSHSAQVQCYIFFFSFPLGRKKKYSNNLTSGHVLFSEQLSTVFHFCFFSRLFSPFHFFLAPLIRERGGIVAAHLLSTALRLVDC